MDSLRLEENEQVINVSLAVSTDPSGGFLTADAVESQVRHYSRSGDLVFAFGREGQGPEELESPRSVLRLPGSRVLVLQATRQVVLSPDGSRVVSSAPLEFTRLYDAALLSDSVVVIAGHLPDREELFHIWNYITKEAIKSFFIPTVETRLQSAAASVGITSVAVARDFIATTFAIADSVYLFDHQGEAIDRLPLQSEYFRPLQRPAPAGSRSPEEFADWVGHYSLITDVFTANTDTLLVQYQDRVNMQPRWRLLALTRAGERLFEHKPTPRLVGVAEGLLFFQDPNSITPNQWIAATWR